MPIDYPFSSHKDCMPQSPIHLLHIPTLHMDFSIQIVLRSETPVARWAKMCAARLQFFFFFFDTFPHEPLPCLEPRAEVVFKVSRMSVNPALWLFILFAQISLGILSKLFCIIYLSSLWRISYEMQRWVQIRVKMSSAWFQTTRPGRKEEVKAPILGWLKEDTFFGTCQAAWRHRWGEAFQRMSASWLDNSIHYLKPVISRRCMHSLPMITK